MSFVRFRFRSRDAVAGQAVIASAHEAGHGSGHSSGCGADHSMPPKNPKAQSMKPPAPNASGEYGEVKFDATKTTAVSASATEGNALVKATVAEVCPKKGCWMSVNGSKTGEKVRVTFIDAITKQKEPALYRKWCNGPYAKVEAKKHPLVFMTRPGWSPASSRPSSSQQLFAKEFAT